MAGQLQDRGPVTAAGRERSFFVAGSLRFDYNFVGSVGCVRVQALPADLCEARPQLPISLIVHFKQAAGRKSAMNWDEIGRILAKASGKRRDYANFFDWPEKSVKEWGIAQLFSEELERIGSIKIVSAKQHPGGKQHAPDWEMTVDTGEVWGVEITELVSQKAIEATKSGKFVLAEWPDNVLIAKFRDRIAKKDRPEVVKGGPYSRYVLLVHVDEDMLPFHRLQAVLRGRSFQTCLIDEIYVLVSYDPAEGRLPLLRLCTVKAGQ